nr:SufD family Fe-S cluster assembly protein [Faecalicatena faecalis]
MGRRRNPAPADSKREVSSVKLNEAAENVLKVIDSYGFKEQGAYNLRLNGMAVCHGDSRHIRIVKKEDKPGIDIFISGEAKDEQVHIPVVMSESGMKDVVYNDFYIEDGADVTIIAGCGIHNDGCSESRHDGIHAFHIGKDANVKYIENHYAEGNGTGGKVLNPVTKIYVGENSIFTLETTQIKGVDSTERETFIELAKGAKLFVTEKLMTHADQSAISNMDVQLNGENSSARIVSRSVAKGTSRQVFHPRAVGNNLCHAHVQCDSIIMDEAEISSIPEINAKHVDAQIVHEAAIGRINDEQLTKLRTFGMSEEEAEAVIIETFLN